MSRYLQVFFTINWLFLHNTLDFGLYIHSNAIPPLFTYKTFTSKTGWLTDFRKRTLSECSKNCVQGHHFTILLDGFTKSSALTISNVKRKWLLTQSSFPVLIPLCKWDMSCNLWKQFMEVSSRQGNICSMSGLWCSCICAGKLDRIGHWKPYPHNPHHYASYGL